MTRRGIRAVVGMTALLVVVGCGGDARAPGGTLARVRQHGELTWGGDERRLWRATGFIATDRGLAAALHSGDSAFDQRVRSRPDDY